MTTAKDTLISQLSARIETLTGELARSQDECRRLRSQLIDVIAERDSLTTRWAVAAEERDELRRVAAECSDCDTIGRLRQQLADANAECSRWNERWSEQACRAEAAERRLAAAVEALQARAIGLRCAAKSELAEGQWGAHDDLNEDAAWLEALALRAAVAPAPDMDAVLAMSVDECKAELRAGGIDPNAVVARGKCDCPPSWGHSEVCAQKKAQPSQAPEPCRAEYLDCEGMVDRCNYVAGHDGRHGDPEPAAGRDESVPPPGWEHGSMGGVLCVHRDIGDGRREAATLRYAWQQHDREHGSAPAAPRLRDESVPPPGWEPYGIHDAYRPDYCRPLSAAWAIYDREHGYAPADRLRRAVCDLFEPSLPLDTPDHEIVARLVGKMAPRLDRFRALAEQWHQDRSNPCGDERLVVHRCARELLAVVSEVERG